jgi:hypothetical protein
MLGTWRTTFHLRVTRRRRLSHSCGIFLQGLSLCEQSPGTADGAGAGGGRVSRDASAAAAWCGGARHCQPPRRLPGAPRRLQAPVAGSSREAYLMQAYLLALELTRAAMSMAQRRHPRADPEPSLCEQSPGTRCARAYPEAWQGFQRSRFLARAR